MNYKFETVEDGKLPTRKTRLSAGFDCEFKGSGGGVPILP